MDPDPVIKMDPEMVPTVDGAGPVALHDAVSEGGGGGLVQPAPSLLHQHLTRRLTRARKTNQK